MGFMDFLRRQPLPLPEDEIDGPEWQGDFLTRNPGFDPHKLPAVRKAMRAFIIANPFCAWCGGRVMLNVHHVKPAHSHPELAAEPSNMITLCGHRGCHRIIGHYGDFRDINPHAPEACAYHGAPE